MKELEELRQAVSILKREVMSEFRTPGRAIVIVVAMFCSAAALAFLVDGYRERVQQKETEE